MKPMMRVPMLAAAIACAVPAAMARTEAEVLAMMKDMVASKNRNLPQAQGEGLRMDRMSAGPGLLLTYHLTVTPYRAAQVKQDYFHNVMGADIRKDYCANTGMGFFRREGITVAYAYSGNDGAPIGTISIPPDACK